MPTMAPVESLLLGAVEVVALVTLPPFAALEAPNVAVADAMVGTVDVPVPVPVPITSTGIEAEGMAVSLVSGSAGLELLNSFCRLQSVGASDKAVGSHGTVAFVKTKYGEVLEPVCWLP
jgi:hypothetical protein